MSSVTPWFREYVSQWNKRIQSNRLHHALLFSGISGLGKAQLAKQVAHRLLCSQLKQHGPCQNCQSCKLFNAESHPDIYRLESEKQIGVELVRQATSALFKTAQISQRKVLIINDADTMSESAANALLKTLEEPTANTYIILVTAHPSRLLPTILSRCEKYSFITPTQAQIIQWLNQQGIHDIPSTDLIEACHFSPEVIANALVNPESNHIQNIRDDLASLAQGGCTSLDIAKRWQDQVPEVLDQCQANLHRLRLSHHDKTSLYAVFEECLRAKKQAYFAGVNKIVLLTSLLNKYKNVFASQIY